MRSKQARRLGQKRSWGARGYTLSGDFTGKHSPTVDGHTVSLVCVVHGYTDDEESHADEAGYGFVALLVARTAAAVAEALDDFDLQLQLLGKDKSRAIVRFHTDVDKSFLGKVKKLAKGEIVVRCTKYTGAVPGDAAGAQDCAEALREAEAISVDRFLFVGFMSFKPYRATFRVCSWPDQARDALGHLQLRCLPEYLSVYELCDSLYAHFSDPGWWTVACLPDHISRRPVGAIDPRQLLVQDLGLESSHRQHFPKPRRLRREGSAVQEDAWLDVLDALDGSEQSEESGDDDEGQEEGEDETHSEQAEDESVEGQAAQSSDSDLDSASHSETSGMSL